VDASGKPLNFHPRIPVLIAIYFHPFNYNKFYK